MTAPPRHQLCTPRDDLRSGELALAEFAVDSNAVGAGDAAMFFECTYPTLA